MAVNSSLDQVKSLKCPPSVFEHDGGAFAKVVLLQDLRPLPLSVLPHSGFQTSVLVTHPHLRKTQLQLGIYTYIDLLLVKTYTEVWLSKH